MSLSKIVDFAISKVSCGYIYGATGWICSEERRKQQAKQYPDYADVIMGIGAKWDGKQCFDCAQLVRRSLEQLGIKPPSGATSQWKSSIWADKGEISTMPDEAGIILYRQTADKKMQHTGIYIGGGEVVDARGHKYGVMRSAISSYPWTHWAKPNVSKNNEKETKPVNKEMVVTRIPGATGSTVNFRNKPNGDVILTIPFGTVVTVTQEQGEWSGFEWNGTPGWMQSRFLSEPSATAPDTGDTITVSRAKLTAIYQELGAMIGE